MKIKYNVPNIFRWKKDALIKRLEKKHHVSINDLDIIISPENSQRGEMIMTLQNENKVRTNFSYRKSGFVFKFNDDEIDWAVAPTAKPDLEKEFLKIKFDVRQQIISEYNIPDVDFEIVQDENNPHRGIIKMIYKNQQVIYTTISYGGRKFYFDFAQHSSLIRTNILHINKREILVNS